LIIIFYDKLVDPITLVCLCQYHDISRFVLGVDL